MIKAKKYRNIFVILVLSVGVPVVAAGEAGAVLTNPSFETGDFTGWTFDNGGTGGDAVLCAGDTFFRGASDGSCSLLLNGGDTVPDAVLSQTFATLPGAGYELSFDLGAFADTTRSVDASVRVELFDGGTLLAGFPVTATDSTATSDPFGSGQFTTFVAPFAATGAAAELRVTDIAGNGGSAFDTLLDNFAVNLVSVPIPVPAPAGLWLFVGGLGLMAAFGRRRRRALP